MSTYLKHMGGYTYKQLKGKSFDEIQKLFDKEMKRVNTFVAMGSEVQENKEKKEEGREETAKGSRKKMLGRKRAGKEQQKESSKKQLNVRGRKRVRGSLKKMMKVEQRSFYADGSSLKISSLIECYKVRLEKTRSSLKDSEEKYGDTRPKLNLKGGLLGSGRNLKILDDEHQFRGGLLGLKRLHGFLEVTAAQVKNRSRIRINTFVSSESTSSTNDVSTAYGVSTSSSYNSQRENSSSYTDELILGLGLPSGSSELIHFLEFVLPFYLETLFQ
ncbi:hypothetical protein Tco_0377068 [Tanacetum coccineum]